LLWANEQEMEQVRSLLIKLGELPPPGGNRKTVRVIDASATPETYEYLKRLKEQWGRIAPNSLELPDQDQFKEPNAIPKSDKKPDEADAEPKFEPVDPDDDSTVARAVRPTSGNKPLFQLTMMQNQAAGNHQDSPSKKKIQSADDFDREFGARQSRPEQQKNPPGPPATIRVEVDSDGNLVLVSPDTDALDRLENLMLQVAPPKRPYHVFHIEHASAFWMRMNLEDYYEDLKEEDSSAADNFYRYFWGNNNSDEDDGPKGLGKGVKLRFVDDPDTNTLVVTGATTRQLRTIAELIELWDVPEPVNKRKTRFT